MAQYIFIINGRKDFQHALQDVQTQLDALGTDIRHQIYVTQGPGDGTRFVRLYCEFHENEETCFVACGGSGTSNEVAAGLIDSNPTKRMAILAYGTTNDLTKYYPGRNFKSIKDLLDGECVQIDAIRCNNDYAINVINLGFDAMVAVNANDYIERGQKNGYIKGIVKALLLHRFNNFRIVADGERISRGLTLLCAIANARYCGGQFLCAPHALVDDGLLDICLIRSMSLLSFLYIMPRYAAGRHPDIPFCRRRMVFRKARHVEMDSKYLRYISLDGEIIASTHFDIDILDKAIRLQLPARKQDQP